MTVYTIRSSDLGDRGYRSYLGDDEIPLLHIWGHCPHHIRWNMAWATSLSMAMDETLLETIATHHPPLPCQHSEPS